MRNTEFRRDLEDITSLLREVATKKRLNEGQRGGAKKFLEALGSSGLW